VKLSSWAGHVMFCRCWCDRSDRTLCGFEEKLKWIIKKQLGGM